MRLRSHFIFAGADTPGQLHSGLAVAQQLVERDPLVRITFVPAPGRAAREPIRRRGFEVWSAGGPWSQLPTVRWLPWVPDLLTSVRQLSRYLRSSAPTAVVALAGNAGHAACRAAVVTHTPLVLLEPDPIPGALTRRWASSACRICTAFGGAAGCLPSVLPIVLTGVPVRPEVARLAFAQRPAVRTGRPTLLALSTGPNQAFLDLGLVDAFRLLRTEIQPWRVVHQTSSAAVNAVRERYERLDLPVEVVFGQGYAANVLARTELAVAPPDAYLLAELACASVPSVIVSPRDRNATLGTLARGLAGVGAAKLVDGSLPCSELGATLAAALRQNLCDANERQEMGQRFRALARPQAAALVTRQLDLLLAQRPLRYAA